jgi:hypothetical protein
MHYLQFIWADGRPTPDQLAVMQRDLPGYDEEMTRRGVRLFGRELRLPETAATVRVRDGQTLVTDGPFAETKEFIAGFDLLDCADLDEAIEVVARCPITQFQPLEIRPFRDGLRLGKRASAFARQDDSAGTPYLLSTWLGATPAAAFEEPAVIEESDAWRRDLQARGLHVLGEALGGPDTATTVRVRDGKTLLCDGPFTKIEEFVAAIDVLSCADRLQAIELAAAHPIARHHAIEVRPFYSE